MCRVRVPPSNGVFPPKLNPSLRVCRPVIIIRHPSSVAPSWLAGVRQITYSSHTRARESARTHTHTHSPGLIRIQPHPGLSNGPNNDESLGASRVSGRLQRARRLDGQLLGSDTHTLTRADTHIHKHTHTRTHTTPGASAQEVQCAP